MSISEGNTAISGTIIIIIINHIKVSVFWSELNNRPWLVATLDSLHGNRGFIERDWLLWLRSAGRDDKMTDYI